MGVDREVGVDREEWQSGRQERSQAGRQGWEA